MKVTDILTKCIEDLSCMSEDDFKIIKQRAGIFDDRYESSKYDSEFNIILPKKTNKIIESFSNRNQDKWESINYIKLDKESSEKNIGNYLNNVEKKSMLDNYGGIFNRSNQLNEISNFSNIKNNKYEEDYTRAA